MENTIQLWVDDQRLDMYDADSVHINQSIQQIRDIQKVFTDFTQQFSVPASRTNSRIFRHALRTDLRTLDPRQYRRARLGINNANYRNGFITLDGLNYKNGEPSSYNIRFFGELVDLPRILGDFTLKDLDTELGPTHDFEFSTTTINSLLTTPPGTPVAGVNDNIKISLNAFDQAYFFDSSSSPIDRGPDYRNIASTTETRGVTQATTTGVVLEDLKPSIKDSALIGAIESKYGIRFSRGLDSTGAPTNVASEVVGNPHFFNSEVFNAAYILLHSKVADEEVENFESTIVTWNNDWGNPLGDMLQRRNVGDRARQAPSATRGTRTSITVSAFDRNTRNRRAYYLNLRVTNAGTGAYRVQIRNQDEETVFDTNTQTGTFQTDQTVQRLTGVRSFIGIPLDVVNNNGSTFDGQISDVLSFYTQADPSADISIEASIFQYDEDSSGLRFTSRQLLEFDNTAGSATGSTSFSNFSMRDNLPKMKIIDYLVGLWKLYNLTAFFSRTRNNEPILVVQTLNNFYQGGTTRDLTQYYDSQNFQITKPEFYSDIMFMHEEPSTFLAKEFEDNNNYNYGDLKYSLRVSETGEVTELNLPRKEYDIHVPFEQVVLTVVRDENNTELDLDLVYGWIANESRRETDVSLWRHYIESATVQGSNEILLRPSNTVTTVFETMIYNAPTKYYRSGMNTLQTLTFGRELDERTLEISDNTLFQNFYREYIEDSFNSYARIWKVKARLPQSFLVNYSLADTILLGKDLFRIIKIDTNLRNGMSMLELISLNDSTQLNFTPRETTTFPETTKLPINPDTGEPDVTPDPVDPDDGGSPVDPTIPTSLTTTLISTNLLDFTTPTGEVFTFVSGANVRIEVESNGGTGAITHVWTRNGDLLEENGNVLLDPSTNVPAGGEATYVVFAQDQAGNTSSSITISVSRGVTYGFFDNTMFTSAGGTTAVTVIGTPGTNVRLDFAGENPADWIENTAYGDATGVIGTNGRYRTTVTVPTASVAATAPLFIENADSSADTFTAVNNDGILRRVLENTVQSISISPLTFDGGGGTATVLVTSDPGIAITLSIQGEQPNDWITDASIADTSLTADSSGNSTTTITVPATTTVGSRTFTVRATSDPNPLSFVTSETVTQTVNGLTSVTLANLQFAQAGLTEDVVVRGDVGTQFTLEVADTTPADWITNTNLSMTSGTIPASGEFTATLTIPAAPTDQNTNRTARIIARNSNDATNQVSTGLFRQMHTVHTQGNLTVESVFNIVGTFATPIARVDSGDLPVTVELFDEDPRLNAAAVAISMATINTTGGAGTNLAAIDTSGFDAGDHVYFFRYTEQAPGTDVVIEMETITIAATPGTGASDSVDARALWYVDQHSGRGIVNGTAPIPFVNNYLVDNADLELRVDGVVVPTNAFSPNIQAGGQFLTNDLIMNIPGRYGTGNTGVTHTWAIFDTSVSPNAELDSGNIQLAEALDIDQQADVNRMYISGIAMTTDGTDFRVNVGFSGLYFDINGDSYTLDVALFPGTVTAETTTLPTALGNGRASRSHSVVGDRAFATEGVTVLTSRPALAQAGRTVTARITLRTNSRNAFGTPTNTVTEFFTRELLA